MHLPRVLLSLSIVFGITSSAYAEPVFADYSNVSDLATAFEQNSSIIEERDAFGNTLLHKSVVGLNVACTQWLLEHGASPRTPNNIGQTPISLFQAAFNQCFDKYLDIQNKIINILANDPHYRVSLEYANTLAEYQRVRATRDSLSQLHVLLNHFMGGSESNTAHLRAICPNGD